MEQVIPWIWKVGVKTSFWLLLSALDGAGVETIETCGSTDSKTRWLDDCNSGLSLFTPYQHQ